MTTIYRDDITGETYRDEMNLERFGIFTFDDLFDDFDVHVDEVHENPEAVAEQMHELVDEWLADFGQFQGEGGDGD